MTSEETTTPDRHRMEFRWRLLTCLAFYGPSVYFKYEGDYVTAAICAVAGVGAFTGYRAGAAYIFGLLIAFLAAVSFAPTIGQSNESMIGQWLGTTGLTNRFASIGLVALVMGLGIVLFTRIVCKRIMKDRPRLEAYNRWTGFAIGSCEAVLALVLFLGGLLVVDQIEQRRAEQRDPEDTRGRMLSQFIMGTAAKTRESRIGPILEAYNPFEKIPQLNKVEEVQQSVQVLSDPAKIRRLMHHPSILRLQQRAEVRRAVDQLNTDPEIRDVLRARRPMDRTMAMTLLSHPAVMELIDQPGFVQEAAKVMRESM